jgi:DNA polymerase III epsilon subunit-like protein
MLDFMFLQQACPTASFNYRFIDLTTVAELYFSLNSSEEVRTGFSLENTAEALNIPVRNSHRALEDVQTCQKIFQKMLKKF